MTRELLNKDGSPMRECHSPIIKELLNETENNMKAILEFNLPEDQMEFDLATNGSKWSLCMWELDQHLRSQTKYAPDTISADTYQALIDTRDKLHEIMNENGLKFD